MNQLLQARSPGLLGEREQTRQERMSPHQLSSLVSGRMEAKALDGDPFLTSSFSKSQSLKLEVIPDQIHFLSLGKLVRAWGDRGVGSVSLRLRPSHGPLSSAQPAPISSCPSLSTQTSKLPCHRPDPTSSCSTPRQDR